MKLYKLFVGIISFCALSASMVVAQNGDQILDGIGETGLIARYTFNEDVKDWSRNNLHGSIHGTDFSFEADELFGNVLSIHGNSETFISIPGESVIGDETFSFTGWIYLRSANNEQVFFDFGKDNDSHILVTPGGINDQEGFQAQIVTKPETFVAKTSKVESNKWVHLAIVVNVPSGTLNTYMNGELVARNSNLNLNIDQLFDNDSGENNKLLIGKSLASDHANLNAKLFDFRIYRIPLSERQIKRIVYGSFNYGDGEFEEEDLARDIPTFADSTPQLYNEYLTAVSDVKVETVVGSLPRLPRFVHGEYSNNIEGPDVRVIWPAPEDNSEVLAPVTYTVTGKIAGSDIQPKATVAVKQSAELQIPISTLEAFDLDQVKLNNDPYGNKTKFIENRDKFIEGLAQTNPDNFLYMFRNTFAQEQPDGTLPLKVWDSQETKLRGHATGHYLTALAQAYASTSCYDEALHKNFADKIEYLVNTLYELSQLSGQPQMLGGVFVSDPLAVPPGSGKTDYDSDLSEEGIRTDYWNWGKGFISAYPPDQFIMLEKGAKYGTDNDKVWAPYYTLHKILVGLMDIYEVSGNEKALEIVKGMGNWVHARMSQLPTDTLISMWNTYIAGEFGGMNEAMARLYHITNESQYLEVAKIFDNIRVFFGDTNHSHGLAKNVDLFRGLHANQHIPQFIGAIEIYSVTYDPQYYHIADNFWHKATSDYMYSIGGVAGSRNNPPNAECFICQPATLYENGFSVSGQNETCATYNMLKLTRKLFLYEQSGELMDYYERGLYNHILASVDENTPANTYHVPLRAGSLKRFSNAHMDGFTCCNGTALESNTKLQNTIYFKSDDNSALFVNLYIPSTLNWTENNITVTQSTAFPKEDHSLLTINGNGKFDLNVRVPHWATKGFFVKINGKDEAVDAEPGNYFTISRKWKDGDTVELTMPFHFYLEPIMDQQNIASLFYGPVLLAAQESEPLKEWREVSFDLNDISKSITGDKELLQFNIDGVVFKPFYESYGRHSVYLNVSGHLHHSSNKE